MVTLDNYYQIYLNKVLSLARTLVIKSDIAAQKLNTGVQRLDPNRPISNDRRTWRYYMNICGEYHWSNKVMEVVSMDTLETIVFNKENLKLHRATLKEYQFGTRRYEELVTRFPGQELLILGILYPAEMEKAISAREGTILSYPPKLVEVNEYTFLNQLQEWIYMYLKHYNVSGYSYTDDLYLSANLGLMYLHLVPAIMTIRKRMCKTNEAHSYHVRQYLASHGFLDDYLDVMTVKQSLRFYQNINWIERNVGKTETQRWLIREVMTERKLPIAEYTLRHDVEEQLGSLYPKAIFKKNSINGLENLSEVDNLSFDELIEKELPISPGNPVHFREFKNEINSSLVNSLSNVLQTKVLESKVTDYSNQKVFKLEETLLNSWIDLAGRGLYKAVIHVTHPTTGERLPLPAKNAFVLYFYAYWKWAMDIDLPTVPAFYAEHVPRAKLVTLADLKEPLPNNFKDEAFLREVLRIMPRPTTIISIEAFYNFAHELNRVSNLQYALATVEEELQDRAWKEIAVARMYCDRYVQLTTKANQTYASWFEENNVETESMTRQDWGNFAKAIFDEATGINLLTTISLRAIHAAMVRLMVQLSSYSVQYIKEINDADALVLAFSSLREGKQHDTSKTSIDVPIDIDGFNMRESEVENFGILFDEQNEDKWEVYEEEHSSFNDLEQTLINVYANTKSETMLFRAHANIDGFVDLPDVSTINHRGSDVVPGIEKWLALPLSEQAKLKDAYGRDYWFVDNCERVPQAKDPISWHLVSPTLDGFDYETKAKLRLDNLAGFDYHDKAKLNVTHVNGFDYADKAKLSLKLLTGFDYQDKAKLNLSHAMGFDYQDKAKLNIKSVMGFDYSDKAKVNVQQAFGFDYDDTVKKQKLTITRAFGFDYWDIVRREERSVLLAYPTVKKDPNEGTINLTTLGNRVVQLDYPGNIYAEMEYPDE